MGKRSGLFFAVLLIASVAQVELPVATAQSAGSDTFDCPSGVISSVDGSCVSEEEAPIRPRPAGDSPGNSTAGGYGAREFQACQLGHNTQDCNPRGLTAGCRVSSTRVASAPLNPNWKPWKVPAAGNPRPLRSYRFPAIGPCSLGTLLPVYGDSLFRQVPSTFAPLREVNVTPDYVLGPGDQLVIRIWGQVNFNAQLTVDRSGSVYLPQVGEIHVAGLPYAQVKQHIHDAVGHIYKSFDLDVEMGQLRSIQVFVVGQARRPGTYTLSSLSTLVTALFATGGPSVQGSLRDIQLRRNGQTITHFDLYDLLILGDMSKDAPLLPGDVIYIPPVGAQVAIAGDVHVPAIYELKGPLPRWSRRFALPEGSHPRPR